MRVMIIRHGDPDYENDTLTERGWKEAELLAKRMEQVEMKDIYVSILGRAMDTASCTLNAIGRTATEVCDWLQEFPAEVEFNKNPMLLNAFSETKQRKDGSFYRDIIWDIYPSYYAAHEELYGNDSWRKSELCAASNMEKCYDHVIKNFDKVLAEHGYERHGNAYQVKEANTDTLVFFCHFGLACVLLSHLMNVSPFALWQGTVLAPTSVTTVCTEERVKGIASFRATQIGDISHLYTGGMEPSFSARFCEMYDDFSQRH